MLLSDSSSGEVQHWVTVMHTDGNTCVVLLSSVACLQQKVSKTAMAAYEYQPSQTYTAGQEGAAGLPAESCG